MLNALKTGALLTSQPLIGDAYFDQSIVYLTNYSKMGAMGFTLNKPSSLYLEDFLDLVPAKLPVYLGGPVEGDSLFYMHRIPEVPNAVPLAPNLYLGGEFDALRALLNEGENALKVKFFLGYSGWAAGQLEAEIEEETWIVSEVPEGMDLVGMSSNGWRQRMKTLGGDYTLWANSPEDPNWN